MRSLATVAAGLATVMALGGCASSRETVVNVTVTTRATTVATVPTAPTTPTTVTDFTSPTASTTSTAPTYTSSDPEQADYPNAGEAYLLELLPAPQRPMCDRAKPADRAANALATITCDMAATRNIRTFYDLFDSVAVLRRAYDAVRKGQRVERGQGPCTRPNAPTKGENTWSDAGKSVVRGRVMCFVSKGRYWIVWTQEDVRVLAWASSARRAAVREYWLKDSALSPG